MSDDNLKLKNPNIDDAIDVVIISFLEHYTKNKSDSTSSTYWYAVNGYIKLLHDKFSHLGQEIRLHEIDSFTLRDTISTYLNMYRGRSYNQKLSMFKQFYKYLNDYILLEPISIDMHPNQMVFKKLTISDNDRRAFLNHLNGCNIDSYISARDYLLGYVIAHSDVKLNEVLNIKCIDVHHVTGIDDVIIYLPNGKSIVIQRGTKPFLAVRRVYVDPMGDDVCLFRNDRLKNAGSNPKSKFTIRSYQRKLVNLSRKLKTEKILNPKLLKGLAIETKKVST